MRFLILFIVFILHSCNNKSETKESQGLKKIEDKNTIIGEWLLIKKSEDSKIIFNYVANKSPVVTMNFFEDGSYTGRDPQVTKNGSYSVHGNELEINSEPHERAFQFEIIDDVLTLRDKDVIIELTRLSK